MNGNSFLADTNSFIYLLDKHPSLQPLLESEWLYCFITEIELLGKPGITEKEVKEIKNMLSVCLLLPHTDDVNSVAIFLRQQYQTKIPDALIAATAIHYNLPLLTFDKDFIRIKELDVILPEL